jgi:hypothetical protein
VWKRVAANKKRIGVVMKRSKYSSMTLDMMMMMMMTMMMMKPPMFLLQL